MPTFESTARITRKYLMNKTKHEVCDVVFLVLDENERLRKEVERLKAKAKAKTKVVKVKRLAKS